MLTALKYTVLDEFYTNSMYVPITGSDPAKEDYNGGENGSSNQTTHRTDDEVYRVDRRTQVTTRVVRVWNTQIYKCIKLI